MPPKKKKPAKAQHKNPPKTLPKDPPIKQTPLAPVPDLKNDTTLEILDKCVPLFKILKEQMTSLGSILDNMEQKHRIMKLTVDLMKLEIKAAGSEVDDDEDDETIKKLNGWADQWFADNMPKVSAAMGIDLHAEIKNALDEEFLRRAAQKFRDRVEASERAEKLHGATY
ncbi:MAG: hypothetical protein MMC33_010783 [Icmadophila ericetorum]|nr:hypothetical protein [Icmadophila ericetorum]